VLRLMILTNTYNLDKEVLAFRTGTNREHKISN